MPPRRRRRDFDEDDYVPRRGPRSGSDSSSQVLLIVVVVGLILFVMCGGLVISMAIKGNHREDALRAQMKQQVEQAEWKERADENAVACDAANKFLNEARNQLIDAAFAMTTANFKKRMNLAQFRDFLARHAKTLRETHDFMRDLNAFRIGGGYNFSEGFDGLGKVEVKVYMVPEGGEWKVERFLLGKEEQ
jgi:hypothetical protein